MNEGHNHPTKKMNATLQKCRERLFNKVTLIGGYLPHHKAVGNWITIADDVKTVAEAIDILKND